MDITEVRVKLMESDQEERLLGFCSITFDHAFVIRDLKIIRGGKGFFVAMPSRKLMDRCPCCSGKNQLRAAYCNQCGVHLDDNRSFKQANGKAKLYSDIAHPINTECRDLIHEKVFLAYEQELILAAQPGYVCRYEDYGEFDIPSEPEELHLLTSLESSEAPQRLRLDRSPPEKNPHQKQARSDSAFQFNDEFGDGLF